LADVDALMRTAAKTGIGAEGHLAIGIVASIAGGRARELLTEFISANPGVELDVIEGTHAHHAAAIRTLRMDVALVVGAPVAAGCNMERLWSEPIFVAVPDKSTLAAEPSLRWDQLGSQRFLVSKANSGPEIHDIVMRHLVDLGRTPVVEPRAVQRSGLLGLVSLGVGISLVGTAEAAVTYPGVAFRPLEGETLPFSAVWTDNNDNPALRRFLSLARVQMRKAP
jgi:DNA-binding transcriptional LysR family regulator